MWVWAMWSELLTNENKVKGRKMLTDAEKKNNSWFANGFPYGSWMRNLEC